MPRSPSNRPTPPPSFGNGRYLVGQRLGTGGMATVFRVEDQWTGEERALKVLFHDEAENEKTRSRFLAEARTMSVLDHRNIVRIHDVGEEHGFYWFVMDVAEGGSLATYLRRYGPRPPQEAIVYAVQALRALDYAHAAGLVHRDIKPHNMLLDIPPDPEAHAWASLSEHPQTVKLTDFGIARVVLQGGARLTGTGDTLGTLAYMSPEQRADPRHVGPASDLYGVTATLYILLTGRRPFELALARLDDHVLARVPVPLRPIIRLGAAHRPEDRYPDARAMADALETVWNEMAREGGHIAPGATAMAPGAMEGDETILSVSAAHDFDEG